MGLNFTAFNPDDRSSGFLLSNGNLTVTTTQPHTGRTEHGVSAGKWYWEVTWTSGLAPMVGIGSAGASLAQYPGSNGQTWAVYGADGDKYHNAVAADYMAGMSAGQTIGVKLDMDAGTLSFLTAAGADAGVAYSGLAGTMFAMIGGASPGASSVATANFGATAFVHDVPSGYSPGLGVLLPTIRVGDRIKEQSSSTGLGAFSLDGAIAGFRSFASILAADGDSTYYCAVAGTQWEIGRGTRLAENVLTRDLVLSSSNADEPVSFTTPPVVFCTVPGGKLQPGFGPAFRAHLSADATGWPNAVATPVEFDVEDFDTDGCYDPGTGRFTPSVPGYYRIDWLVTADVAAQLTATLYKNGLPIAESSFAAAGAGDVSRAKGADLVFLDGNDDYVEVQAHLAAGGGTIVAGTGSTYLAGHLARAA